TRGLYPYWARRAWALSESRRPAALRYEPWLAHAQSGPPRAGLDQRHRSEYASSRRDVGDPWRRKSGHGERYRRRAGAVGVWPLRRGGVRLRDHYGTPYASDPGRP